MVRITISFFWIKSGHYRFFILPSIVTSKIGFLNFKSCISITNLLHHHHNHPFFRKEKKNEGKKWNRIEKKDTIAKIWWRTLCALSLKYDVVNATPLKCAYVILKVITVSLWLQIGVEGRERRPLLYMYRHCVEPAPRQKTAVNLTLWWHWVQRILTNCIPVFQFLSRPN